MNKKYKRIISLFIITTFVFISLFGSVAMAEKGKSNDNGIRLRIRECDKDRTNNSNSTEDSDSTENNNSTDDNNCDGICNCDCQNICDCDQLEYKIRKQLGQKVEEQLEVIIAELEKQLKEANENGETERIENLNKELERIRNRIKWLKDQKENNCGEIYQNQFSYQLMFSIGNDEEEQQ